MSVVVVLGIYQIMRMNKMNNEILNNPNKRATSLNDIINNQYKKMNIITNIISNNMNKRIDMFKNNRF